MGGAHVPSDRAVPTTDATAGVCRCSLAQPPTANTSSSICGRSTAPLLPLTSAGAPHPRLRSHLSPMPRGILSLYNLSLHFTSRFANAGANIHVESHERLSILKFLWAETLINIDLTRIPLILAVSVQQFIR